MYAITLDNTIVRVSDGATIGQDARNRDYRDYVAWLEAGHVARLPDMETRRTDALRRLKATAMAVVAEIERDRRWQDHIGSIYAVRSRAGDPAATAVLTEQAAIVGVKPQTYLDSVIEREQRYQDRLMSIMTATMRAEGEIARAETIAALVGVDAAAIAALDALRS